MGTPSRWDRWFLAVAIPFGLFLAVATPPMQELDAAYHLPRVHRIARGTFVEPVSADGSVEPTIDACLHGFMTLHTDRASGDEALGLRGNWSATPCTTPTVWGLPNAALTSPVPYLPAAAGYGLAGALGGGVNVRYLAARLTVLAVYIAAVWAAIRVAPRGRAVLFAVAVLPSSLALAAGMTADATAIWAAILAVALVLRCRVQPTRWALAGLAATVVVLALSKNLYGPHVLLLLLVPAAAFTDVRDRVRYVGVAGATAVVSAGLWASYASGIRYRIPFLDIDSERAGDYVSDHPLSFLRAAWNGLWDPFTREVTLPGFVEILGGLRPARVDHLYGDLAPAPLVALAFGVLVAAVLADPGPPVGADRRRRVQTGLVVGAIVAATTLLVFIGLALTANPPGADTILWAQGRYFLPLVPLAAFAAGRRVARQPWFAWAVPVGSLSLLAWVSWRVHVLFYAP